jgi:hypothetical protein
MCPQNLVGVPLMIFTLAFDALSVLLVGASFMRHLHMSLIVDLFCDLVMVWCHGIGSDGCQGSTVSVPESRWPYRTMSNISGQLVLTSKPIIVSCPAGACDKNGQCASGRKNTIDNILCNKRHDYTTPHILTPMCPHSIICETQCYCRW